MSSSPSRTTVFVRLIGLVFVILGATSAFYTASTPLVQPLVGVFFFIAILLIGSGLLALIAELK